MRLFPLICLMLMVALQTLARQALAAQMCMPSDPLPPCAQHHADPGKGTTPVLNMGIGNPVHLATGNKHQKETDFPESLLAPGVELVRYYNALDPSADSGLETGWRLSYDARLQVTSAGADLRLADGNRLRLDMAQDHAIREHNSANTPEFALLPANTQTGHALRQTNDGWQLTWPDARQWFFDRAGRLVRVTTQETSGNSILLKRHTAPGPLQGLLAEVGHDRHQLRFHYVIRGRTAFLHAVDTPLGRIRYVHEHLPGRPHQGLAALSRLSHVIWPNSVARQYLYEPAYQAGNRHLITGVIEQSSDGMQQRLSSWDYDAHGRAIGVAMGERIVEHGYSRIHYRRPATELQPGLTEVLHGKGRTQLRFIKRQDQYLLTSVQGDGCPACPAPGTQATYDAAGRMQSINGTQIMHDPSGNVIAISPMQPGWPGLVKQYDPVTGDLTSWKSDLTGRETLQHDANARRLTRQFANGDTAVLAYDDNGLPISLVQTKADSAARKPFPNIGLVAKPEFASPAAARQRATVRTTLTWNALRQPVRIAHPAETDHREYDQHGRLTLRQLERPIPKLGIWRLQERFHYDTNHRLTRHDLPEGGALLYDWGQEGRLRQLTWETADGKRQIIITSQSGQAGYRHGNGLQVLVSANRAGRQTLRLFNDKTVLWQLTQWHHPDGSVRRQKIQFSPDNASIAPHQQDWHYRYDHERRLVLARETRSRQLHWYAWQENGALSAAMARHPSGTSTDTGSGSGIEKNAWHFNATRQQHPTIPRDASGLPLEVDGYRLIYGPARRLTRVMRNHVTVANYEYNAFGHRVRARYNAHNHHAEQHFLYTGNRLSAQAMQADSRAFPQITRRYIYANHVPVGMIVYDQRPSSETNTNHTSPATATLYAIHTDLTGTPHLVTDARQHVRWHAIPGPMGQMQKQGGDLRFSLRQPGQYADPVTGWHDNLLRTYHPGLGQYLEPDPIGPIPGSQALGYAAQQPQRFVDPLGLLLFAFDGTRNNHRTGSNVSLLSALYQDGNVYYHRGPGNPYYLNLDAAIAHTAPQIIQTQWLHLLNALHDTPNSPIPVPIDIIGFSRGAALALHFGNLINDHTRNGLFSYEDPSRGLIRACVDLRFMGLMDTVAQFGADGAQNGRYSLAVADTWQWVAHAVALNEHRALFPLTSLETSPTTNIAQQPFIGSHGDIGGGNTMDAPEARQGDLSDVALQWLWAQARSIAVPFAELPRTLREISDPLLNDARGSGSRVIDADRRVDDTRSRPLHYHQQYSETFGRQQRKVTEQFITRLAGWRTSGLPVVGIVDMGLYYAWLRQATTVTPSSDMI